MQQRVSIARALAFTPELLILDEPFRGLDQKLREEVIALIRSLSLPSGLLLATHSAEEAEALDCRILRWQDGTFVE
jgi:ABC-type multidrug transport system ATPase subunit